MKKLIICFAIVFTGIDVFSQTIDLPAPRKTGGMPLMDALAKRSTARAFDTKELSMQQLSDLLWAAFGVNRPDGKRTAPSAMNYQETNIYVLLKQGAYVYDAKDNKLNQVLAEDIRSLGGTQAFVKDAPVTLIYVADLTKMGKGSNEDKMNMAYVDVGFIAQNVYLFCASEELVTGARMSIDKAALGSKLNLKIDQAIILGESVGYPKH
jgi:nitroreductase